MASKQVSQELWNRGVVCSQILRPYQRKVTDFIKESVKEHVLTSVEQGRQTGKSFSILAWLIEEALNETEIGSQYAIVMPTQRSARGIFVPALRRILQNAPPDTAVWRTQDSSIFIPKTAVTIRLVGADRQPDQALRGASLRRVYMDEGAFFVQTDIKELFQSIILPATAAVDGRVVMSSTPPLDLANPYLDLLADAKADGAHIKLTYDDVPERYISKTVREKLFSKAGSKKKADGTWDHSPTALREFFCDLSGMAASTNSIVPEMLTMATKVVKQIAAPGKNYRFTVIDLGWSSMTAALYCYWDWKTATLCVQREQNWKYTTAEMVADDVRKTEKELWGAEPHYRFMDGDAQLLAGLVAKGFWVYPVAGKKLAVEAMVNGIRTGIRENQMAVDPACTMLIDQLTRGTWANGNRNEFAHTAEHHHDHLAALTYAWLLAPRYEDPSPNEELRGMSFHSHSITPAMAAQQNDLEDAVSQLLKR